MNKVFLITIDWVESVTKEGSKFNPAWPPLDLLNCASLLKQKGIASKVIDLRFDKLPKISKEDFVFITSSQLNKWLCPNTDLKSFFDVIKRLPKENLFVLGAHGTFFPKRMLIETRAKAIVRGEPEETVVEICSGKPLEEINGLSFAKKGKLINTPDRKLIDLNLPIPAYELIDIKKYFFEILGNNFVLLETSRGCPYNCEYCFKGMVGTKIRRKPIENVLKELEAVCRLGAKSLYFFDLEFTIDRAYAVELCQKIIDNKIKIDWACQTRADLVDFSLLDLMKRAGCKMVQFGLESGSEMVLKATNKNVTIKQVKEAVCLAKKAGLETLCYIMIGFPNETKADINATIKCAKEINPTYVSFNILTPYPNVFPGDKRFFPNCLKEHDYSELNKEKTRAFMEFYLRPSYILSRLVKPNLWRKQFKLFLSFTKRF